MDETARLFHLFERFGIEIEYMIVDKETLGVKPVADRLISMEAGDTRNDVERGAIAWSNELALHLIEMKTNGPVSSLEGLDTHFLENVCRANSLLEEENACLLGGGMHPFMNPHGETVLWPHAYGEIYKAFDRIFSCSRHGWANLQSVHINLPFANDEEFGRLHAAIRLVLPIIPALAAGSPLIDNRCSGFLDTRMEAYRTHTMLIPSMMGDLIPEPVYTMHEYQAKVLTPIYRDLAQFDPEKTLCEEWVNARGAIARFDRNTIEIRVVDAQETPSADLAVATAIIGAVKLCAHETFSSLARQQSWPPDLLKDILLDTIKTAETTVITNTDYLKTMGVPSGPCTAGDLWKHLIRAQVERDPAWIAPFRDSLERIMTNGTLASRICRAMGAKVSWKTIDEVYRKLCECLSGGTQLP